MKLDKRYKELLTVFVITTLLFILINDTSGFFSFFKGITDYFSVFIIGAIIAFFLNPIMELLEKKLKIPGKISILIIYLGLLISIIIFAFFIAPKLIKNISDLINALPKFLYDLEGTLDEQLDIYMERFPYLDSLFIKDQMDKINERLIKITQSTLRFLAENILSVTFSLLEFLIGLIFSIFFLSQKKYFKNLGIEVVKLTFKKKNAESILFFARKVNDIFLSYLHGKTLDCIIIGLIAFVGLLFLKVPYAVFLWLFITFTNFIPYLGPFLGMCLAAIITAFVNPGRAIFVFLFLLALQQFDAWLLGPYILGNKLKIKAFWTIAAITLGGSLAGAIGIIISAPVAGLIKEFYLIKKSKDADKLID